MDKDFLKIAKKKLTIDEIKELYSFIKPIIEHYEFQKRKKYKHHDNSVFEHSVLVCIRAYKISKVIKCNKNDVIISSLLHDFYFNPWQGPNRDKKKYKLLDMHGFRHSKEAAINSKFYFEEKLNQVIIDSIRKHMWPLTVKTPKYREGWIVTISDKIESINVFINLKSLPKYLGIKVKEKKDENN